MGDCVLIIGSRGGELRTRVEAEPTEPKDEDTEGSDCEAVTRNGLRSAVLVILADTRTDDSRTDECNPTTDRVDDGRTSEVVECRAEEVHHERAFFSVAEPASAPSPVTRDRVDENGDENGVNQVHGELSALCHRTRYDCCGSGAEDSLEDKEAFFGQAVGVVEHAIEEVRHADETTVTEHQTEAYEPEKERAEGEVDEVLHQYVSGVLRAGETCLDHCETRLHEEDEHSGEQHPDGVDASREVTD